MTTQGQGGSWISTCKYLDSPLIFFLFKKGQNAGICMEYGAMGADGILTTHCNQAPERPN
jgi:hypothetical protein